MRVFGCKTLMRNESKGHFVSEVGNRKVALSTDQALA